MKVQIRFIIEQIKKIYSNSWCDKVKSLYLSLKYNSFFIVAPHTKVIIEKGASISIEGALFYNQPWHGKQYQSATLYISENSSFIVNGVFTFYSGADISVERNATLQLGSGYMNNNGNISCFSSIQIGSDVAISKDVTIRDSDSHQLIRENCVMTKPIVIHDHVWIGLRSTVLKGVIIGSHSVVAAGAVVVKSIPEKSLCGGVPARIIKNSVDWK